MSINDCPREVLGLFVQSVSCETSLRNLRVVNSTFCDLATPRAFRTAYVTNTPSSAIGLKSLMECTPLAQHVTAIVFRSSDVPEEIRRDRVGQKAMHVALISVFAQLHRFPAVTALDLRFVPQICYSSQNAQSQPDDSERAGFDLQVVLQSLVRNTQLPTIRTLTLDNMIAFPFSFYGDAGFARLVSQVDSLRVCAHGTDNLHAPGQNTEELWELMWQETIPIHFLMPSQRQLTSLALISNQPVPHVELGALFYPALRRLELGSIVFTSTRIVEDFVVRHRQTLVALVLDSCPMYVGADDAPARTWAEVCDRFHEELEGLVDVQIRLRTEWGLDQMEWSEGIRLTYEHSQTGFGYSRGRYCAEYEEADRPAVNKFVDGVYARKQRLEKREAGTTASTVTGSPPVEIPPVQSLQGQSFVVPIM